MLYINLVAWKWIFRRTELVSLTVWKWFWHCGSRTPRSVDISNHIFTLGVSRMFQTGCRRCLPGDLGEIPCHLIWDLWWTELYWDSLFSGYFGFSASVSLPTRVPYSVINLCRSCTITADSVVILRTKKRHFSYANVICKKRSTWYEWWCFVGLFL